MKRYELKLVDGGKGVFKVSVVKDPAIESTLVYFSKEKEEVTMFADEEKKVIYSVVMRPDLDIFRKNIEGEPANVYYTKETVEKAQINYFRQNGNSSTNINHSDVADADGIFPFESWIVTDAKTDRALKFGLDVKDGDWVMGLKVDNEEIWNEHIKTGKLDGFSVEATNINYELKEDTKMNAETKEPKAKKSVWDELIDLITMKKQEQFATETPEEEAKRLETEKLADESQNPEPEATKTSLTDEEIKALQEENSMLKSENADLKAQLATLKAENVKENTELETMKSDVIDLKKELSEIKKKTPAARFIKDLPTPVEVKEYKDMTNAEKMRFNRENKKY